MTRSTRIALTCAGAWWLWKRAEAHANCPVCALLVVKRTAFALRAAEGRK